MKIIGLTGGIGSGKTTVAYMFKELNAPVYIADLEAKNLTNSSIKIKQKLINLLGEEAYVKEEFRDQRFPQVWIYFTELRINIKIFFTLQPRP